MSLARISHHGDYSVRSEVLDRVRGGVSPGSGTFGFAQDPRPALRAGIAAGTWLLPGGGEGVPRSRLSVDSVA